MRIAVDIDGTLCPECKRGDRFFAQPNLVTRDFLNILYEAGDEIFFYTARSWEEYKLTRLWLESAGFKFTELICGKINYDVFVDDRTVINLEGLKQWLEKRK